MANHLYNRSPRDGTAMGVPNRSAPTEPLFGNAQARYSPTEFNWIGSMNNEVSVCGVWHTAPLTQFQDMKTRELIVGSTSPGDDTNIFPTVINNVLGTRMKIVSGYPGGNDINIALERGEVEGRCGMSYSSLVSTRPAWLQEKKFRILLQISTAKHPDLPDVPLVMDVAGSERQRQIMKLLFARQLWGRPIVAPPQVPSPRLAALRRAFVATMNDREFIREAATAKIEITPVDGQTIQSEIVTVLATPKDIVAAAIEASRMK
jgi:tripartite-type tricarboxylate transporter receptor subunit TctC